MGSDIVSIGLRRVQIAAEYLVLSRLLQRGYEAAVIPGSIDEPAIMVPLRDGPRHYRVEVVPSFQARGRGWTLPRDRFSGESVELFYAMVDFTEKVSQVYVLPAELVEMAVAQSQVADPPEGRTKGNRGDRISNKMPGMSEGWMDSFLERWDFFEPLILMT